jgi:hypothetical protein
MANESQSEPAATPKLKRRWFQYSTRVLLVVVTVSGVMLGIVGWRAERQRQAVASVKRIGGHVYYNYTETLEPGLELPTFPRWLPRDWCENVVMVEIETDKLTDADLVHLQAFSELESLALYSPHVTDAGLMHLRGISTLVVLKLDLAQVTDAGVMQLQCLSRLSRIEMVCPKVTDDGIQFVEGLTELIYIDLVSDEVTDKGIIQFRHLKNLQILLLDCPRVSDAGVAELEAAIPTCIIVP